MSLLYRPRYTEVPFLAKTPRPKDRYALTQILDTDVSGHLLHAVISFPPEMALLRHGKPTWAEHKRARESG